MTATDSLNCLLEKGLISQAQYNAAIKFAAITQDLGVIFSLSGVGRPISMTSLDNIDETTPKSFSDIPESSIKAVLTAHGNDVIFTVTGDDPSSSLGHIMKEGINYTFTIQELKDAKFIALDNSSNATISATFYR